MFKSIYRFAIVILSLNFCVIGCNRLPPPPEGLPKLYPCKITVTFGGEIIEGINVSLKSSDPNFKWTSGGITDKNGVAEIRTAFAYPGAPEGNFIVSFNKVKEERGYKKNKSDGTPIITLKPISVIPLKYIPGKSTETVEIKKGKNEFTFTLDGGQERLPMPQEDLPDK